MIAVKRLMPECYILRFMGLVLIQGFRGEGFEV